MDLKEIAVDNFNANIFSVLNQDWMLLTAGDFHGHKFNCMTVSWGFMGTFWSKPVVIAGVRPQRFTSEFMDDYESFTLSAFAEEYKQALSFCGANSGREVDKIRQAGLTAEASDKVSAPGYAEAELIIECRKIYGDRLEPKNFIDKSIISECYKNRDFHKLFFGEVVKIRGAAKYCRKTLSAD